MCVCINQAMFIRKQLISLQANWPSFQLPAPSSHTYDQLSEDFLWLPELLGHAWGSGQVCWGINMTLPSSKSSVNY